MRDDWVVSETERETPIDGFHVGGGWWFICEPGNLVRLRKAATPSTGARSEWLMDAETWRSVTDFVAAHFDGPGDG